MKNDNGKFIFHYILNKLVGFEYTNTSGTKEYLYIRNIQGDITSIIDTKGNIICTYAYDGYGNHIVLDENGKEDTSLTSIGHLNPFRYRGYYFDEESGLYYLNSRYYDPETGRFISPDVLSILDETKGQINGLNLYMYCNDNPIMYVDPSGYILESIVNWFKNNWIKLAIGTTILILGAVVTALTAGTGVGFIAAFGSALLTSIKSVGISMAISTIISTTIGGLTGGFNGAMQGFVDGLVDGFMWGAIFAGGAQILSGGFKQLAKLGVNVRKNSFFKIFTPNRLRGETEIARIAGHGQKYYEYGGTLLKIGKNMLDVSNKTFLHLHLWFTGSAHIPFGTILAGIIGGF